MQIFHNRRRDLIAKALIDVFKLSLVAACVSGFFPALTDSTRTGVFILVGLTFFIGILICPKMDKED